MKLYRCTACKTVYAREDHVFSNGETPKMRCDSVVCNKTIQEMEEVQEE